VQNHLAFRKWNRLGCPWGGPANALRRFWRKSGARTTPSVMPSRYALRAVKAAPRVKRTFKGFELWFEKRESIT